MSIEYDSFPFNDDLIDPSQSVSQFNENMTAESDQVLDYNKQQNLAV